MKKPIFAANWKMYKTARETKAYLRVFLSLVSDLKDREIVIAPPFLSIPAARAELPDDRCVALAAQNIYPEVQGAYTGEISPVMLAEFGVRLVIVGHSERRHLMGEGDDLVARKVFAVMENGMRPILCIGETLKEREDGATFTVLGRQLAAGFSGVTLEKASQVVVAYEPVWAIGTGKTATPAQAQEVHQWVRGWLARRFDPSIADGIRILYGGSVKPENIDNLMAEPDIDGALVGGASLDAEDFSRISHARLG